MSPRSTLWGVKWGSSQNKVPELQLCTISFCIAEARATECSLRAEVTRRIRRMRNISSWDDCWTKKRDRCVRAMQLVYVAGRVLEGSREWEISTHGLGITSWPNFVRSSCCKIEPHFSFQECNSLYLGKVKKMEFSQLHFMSLQKSLTVA